MGALWLGNGVDIILPIGEESDSQVPSTAPPRSQIRGRDGRVAGCGMSPSQRRKWSSRRVAMREGL